MESDLPGWNPFKGRAKPPQKAKAKTKADKRSPKALAARPMVLEANRGQVETSGPPRFHSTAGDQVSGSGRLNAARAKLRHAFTPSQPVGDRRLFAGREQVLGTVIRSIEDQRLHVVLYGERGIGKTSLLHVLTQAARDARYIVVYTSCGANSNFDDTFRAAAAEIPLLFHSGYSPTAAETEKGATLADLLPQERLSPRKFSDLCARLTGTRVLIILDEFDRAESGAFRRDVAELIKNLSDRLGRVQLVLAGVAADLTELVEHIPSIRRNIFALRVPKMTEAEVLQIVANGERESDIAFDADAQAGVVAIAGGSPYIAGLICHHAAHAALDASRMSVVLSDVGWAVSTAVEEFESRVPKYVQLQVNRLMAGAGGEGVAQAARAALAHDGAFTRADLAAGADGSAARAEKIIETLTSEGLLRAVVVDGEPSFTFVEEGLPTLIWMLWAQSNFQAPVAGPKAAAAS